METKRNKIWLIIPVLVILGAIIKQLVVTYITPYENVEIIQGLLDLRFIRHYDVFHLNLSDNPKAWVLSIVMLLMVFIIELSLRGTKGFDKISWFLTQVFEKAHLQVSLYIVVAGVLGNIIDKSFRGYVVDYLYFLPNTSDYVYNLEDLFIYGGYIAFIIGILVFGIAMIGNRVKNEIKDNRKITLFGGISR